MPVLNMHAVFIHENWYSRYAAVASTYKRQVSNSMLVGKFAELLATKPLWDWAVSRGQVSEFLQ